MSARKDRVPSPSRFTTKSLLIASMVLTVVVLGLTVAIVASRPGKEPAPKTMAERDLKQWRSLVAGNPKSPAAYTGLGFAQLEVGSTADARKSFERAVSLDPDYWAAGYQLATLIAASDPKRADELLDHAAKLAPATQKVGPYLALGDLRMEAGDAKGARTAYELAVADAPSIIEARVGLARALEKLGDPAGALKQYREALSYNPSDQQVAAAVARLEKPTSATTAATTMPSSSPSEETSP